MEEHTNEALSYDSRQGTFYHNGQQAVARQIQEVKELLLHRQNSIREVLSERDRRYEERFRAQEVAVLKAEEAQRQYNNSHNDLVRKMDDQYKFMMPRLECEKAFGSHDLRVSEIKDSVVILRIELMKEITFLRESRSNIEGRSGGLSSGWVYLVGAMSLVSTIIAAVGFMKP